jgi:hypothetical protein
VAPGVPIATPLQSFARRAGSLCPKAGATFRGVGGVFSAGDVFATVAAAAARFRQCPDGLQIVGLFYVPSLTALPSGRWRPTARGFPSRQAEGSGRPVALHSWPSPLLRRCVPARAVPCPAFACQGVPRSAPWPVPAWRGTPLLGLSKDRPSIDISAWCPLPVERPRSAGWLRRAALWCSPGRRGPRGASRVLGRGRDHRPGDAIFRTRSVLAVPPGCDGLLHQAPCRLVASCCRSWGSPRFRSFARRACRPCGRWAPLPAMRSLRGAFPACLGVPERRLREAAVWRTPGRGLRGMGTFPGGAGPFGAFPSPAAVPCHHGRCPLAVGRGPFWRPECSP